MITYKFLLDKPTNDSLNENNVYKDILYLNVTHHGYAYKYGEKVYKWYKYVHENYPDAVLGARIDDDVFLVALTAVLLTGSSARDKIPNTK
jgi:hypothetical protein